jgi:hypothetical protein
MSTYSIKNTWLNYLDSINKGWNLTSVRIKDNITQDNKICKIAIPHTKNGCSYIEYISKDLLVEN